VSSIPEILRAVQHRPWLLPRRPWIMVQTWHDLLFAHWRLAPQVLRPLVPEQLELDLYDGSAWVAVAPFWMSGVRARGLPPLPGLSRFPELNVRTYVTLGGKPGVFFFSLDAANPAAVCSARVAYHLPYYHARMRTERCGEAVHYGCERLQGPRTAEFRSQYRPLSPVFHSEAGSLEHFLTERYCLYAVRGRQTWRGEIHHVPWPLQRAEAVIEKNTMASAVGLELPNEAPHLLFARELKVLVWWPEKARTQHPLSSP